MVDTAHLGRPAGQPEEIQPALSPEMKLDPGEILPPYRQAVQRKEDGRLLTGKGRFSDDFHLPGQAYAALVRSPYAHAPKYARSIWRRRLAVPACSPF